VVVAVRAVFITAPPSAKHGEIGCRHDMGTCLSSNSRASLRNAFLHFLHTKTISKLCRSGWSAASWWHSAQSNHFLPACYEHLVRGAAVEGHSQQGERMATWAFRTCLLQGTSAAAAAVAVRACFLTTWRRLLGAMGYGGEAQESVRAGVLSAKQADGGSGSTATTHRLQQQQTASTLGLHSLPLPAFPAPCSPCLSLHCYRLTAAAVSC
jgi:hypothetical protein